MRQRQKGWDFRMSFVSKSNRIRGGMGEMVLEGVGGMDLGRAKYPDPVVVDA